MLQKLHRGQSSSKVGLMTNISVARLAKKINDSQKGKGLMTIFSMRQKGQKRHPPPPPP